MLYDVHIGGGRGPQKYCDVMFFEPCGSELRSVLGIIVLLEYNVLWIQLQVTEASKKGFSKDVAVLNGIEVASDPMKPACSIP